MCPTVTIHMLVCLKFCLTVPLGSCPIGHFIWFLSSHTVRRYLRKVQYFCNKRIPPDMLLWSVMTNHASFHLLWHVLKEKFHQSSSTYTDACFSKGVSPKFLIKRSAVLLFVAINSTINWPSSFKFLSHQY